MKLLALLSFGLILGLSPAQAFPQNDAVVSETETDPGDYSELFDTSNEGENAVASENTGDQQEVKDNKDKKAEKKAKKDKKKDKKAEKNKEKDGKKDKKKDKKKKKK